MNMEIRLLRQRIGVVKRPRAWRGAAPILCGGLLPLLGACHWETAPIPPAAAVTNASVAPTPEPRLAKEGVVKEQRRGTWTPHLTSDEQRTLFAIAQDTLAWCVQGEQGAFAFDPYALTPTLKTLMGTFVTLKIHGDLRGCIGSLEAVDPLYLSVHKNALAAALHDYRFAPLRPAELAALEVHVSILSPNRAIATIEEFTLGAHGIILSKGGRRAVFLPEVALEQGWTREETLSYLSRKAGLPADAWKQDAQFQVFESVVLSVEKETP